MLLLFLFESNFFFCLDYSRVNNLLEFVNLWFQKKKKIKPEYFYPKNHRTYFPIATPAARVSHSTRGSLPATKAEILTVIFWSGNYKGKWSELLLLQFFIWRDNFFFCLDTKETKNQASIFLHQKSSDAFPYRDPSRSRSGLDLGATPFCQRRNPYRDFLV
jgi:hypothetical protein